MPCALTKAHTTGLPGNRRLCSLHILFSVLQLSAESRDVCAVTTCFLHKHTAISTHVDERMRSVITDTSALRYSPGQNNVFLKTYFKVKFSQSDTTGCRLEELTGGAAPQPTVDRIKICQTCKQIIGVRFSKKFRSFSQLKTKRFITSAGTHHFQPISLHPPINQSSMARRSQLDMSCGVFQGVGPHWLMYKNAFWCNWIWKKYLLVFPLRLHCLNSLIYEVS